MPGDDFAVEQRRLTARIKAVRTRLAGLPSSSWAKEATNRRRARLVAQLNQYEADLYHLRQSPLFPRKERLKGENA
jgi:hypothetical protein